MNALHAVKEATVILNFVLGYCNFMLKLFFPGPISLIQFKVWQCGTIDLNMLCELLKSAVRHSVCDIILEYYLLTAPICRVPAHYCKGMLSPMHSAPSSPNNTVSLGNCLWCLLTYSLSLLTYVIEMVRSFEMMRLNRQCKLHSGLIILKNSETEFGLFFFFIFTYFRLKNFRLWKKLRM